MGEGSSGRKDNSGDTPVAEVVSHQKMLWKIAWTIAKKKKLLSNITDWGEGGKDSMGIKWRKGGVNDFLWAAPRSPPSRKKLQKRNPGVTTKRNAIP